MINSEDYVKLTNDEKLKGFTPFNIDLSEKYQTNNNEITPFSNQYLNSLIRQNYYNWCLYLHLCSISGIVPISFAERRKIQKRRAGETFRKNNREKCRLKSAENYRKNKSKILLNAKTYYVNNKESILEAHKRYINNNKEIILQKKRDDYAKHRISLLKNKHETITKNIQTNVNNLFRIIGNPYKICPYCKKQISTLSLKSFAIHHINPSMKTMNPNDFIKNYHTYNELKRFCESEGGFEIMHFGCHIAHHNNIRH